MSFTARHLALPALVTTLLLAGLAPANAQTQYNITLTNITNSSVWTGSPLTSTGQAFSPMVFTTHDGSEHLWQFGQTASLGIRNIAEAGNRTVLVSDITPKVGSSVLNLRTPLSSPMLPGNSVSLSILSDAAHPFLSAAWMLGWTNDGFSGLDSLDLTTVRGTKTLNLVGYDAGTEINSEATGFLGALGGGNARQEEGGVITVHQGIRGDVNAPAAWDWVRVANGGSGNPATSFVARLTISVAPEPATLGLVLFALPLIARRKRTLA